MHVLKVYLDYECDGGRCHELQSVICYNTTPFEVAQCVCPLLIRHYIQWLRMVHDVYLDWKVGEDAEAVEAATCGHVEDRAADNDIEGLCQCVNLLVLAQLDEPDLSEQALLMELCLVLLRHSCDRIGGFLVGAGQIFHICHHWH